MTTTHLDHLNVKIYARQGARVQWHDIIPIFHRWIRENVLPGTLIDVADYAHVPAGPGILLISHDVFYSVDNRENRLGFLYNQRTASDAPLETKLRNAYEAACRAALLLQNEPSLRGMLAFDEQSFEVFVNDRLLAPNSDETEKELTPAVEQMYLDRFQRPAKIDRDLSDPRGLFRLRVRPSE